MLFRPGPPITKASVKPAWFARHGRGQCGLGVRTVEGGPRSKLISAEQAAALIRDGCTIAVFLRGRNRLLSADET